MPAPSSCCHSRTSRWPPGAISVYLAEAQLGGPDRERIGNAVYGTYGSDFATADGARFMIVALIPRHFRDLAALTGTTEAVAALEAALEATLGVDFRDEGTRYRHREVLGDCLACGSASTPRPRSRALWRRPRSFMSATAPSRRPRPARA